MKRIFTVLVTFSFATITFAAAGLEQRITEKDVLRGHFTEERILKGFDAPLKSEGHFVIAPKYGLLWKTEKPFAITTIITPTGLVQDVNGNETTRMSADRMPFMTRLYEMLSGTLAGNWAPLEADFTVTKSGTTKSWHVDLVPKRQDPAMPFSKISVSGSHFVDHVELQKPDGDSDNLTFNQQILSGLPLTAAETASFAPASK